MKALDKDRSRRYETATGFAADIENYLTDQPVTASPPSTSYRLRKFAKRNKASLTTAALLITTMLILIATSISQTFRAEEQRKLAEQSAKDSKAVLRFFRNKVLLAPTSRSLMVGGLGINVTIREAVDVAEPQVEEAFKGQPLVEASIRSTLSVTYKQLGDQNAAKAQNQRALELRRQANKTKLE